MPSPYVHRWDAGPPDQVQLRPLDPGNDRGLLENLWRSSLPVDWPLLPVAVDLLRGGAVAEVRGDAVGVAAWDAPALQLLLVAPDHRRRGVGSALFNAASAAARRAGYRRVSLGSGGHGYIWPGVPTDLPGGVAFFEALGYRWEYTAIDLTLELAGWQPSTFAVNIASAAPTTIVHVASVAQLAPVLEFERTHFPGWTRHFEPGDGVLAAHRGGRVVGSLLWSASGSQYSPALASPCGSIGCVGVHPAEQRRGIGTALVLEATRAVRARGAATCHIGWAWRGDLYERLGYVPWRQYRMSSGRRSGPRHAIRATVDSARARLGDTA